MEGFDEEAEDKPKTYNRASVEHCFAMQVINMNLCLKEIGSKVKIKTIYPKTLPYFPESDDSED